MTKKKLFPRALLIFIICLIHVCWAAFWIYKWKESGQLISASKASSNIPGIFLQNLITCAPFILLFIVAAIKIRPFATELYFTIKGKVQWTLTIILAAALLALTTYCLITKADKVTILYNLFYYLVFIAFVEEVLDRDFCTWLLKDEKTWIRYLLPNLMFAAMHIFSYSSWQSLTWPMVSSFMSTQFIGLLLSGLVFQLLKEKTGTIWVPVLLHAILDFSSVLKLA